MSCRLVKQLFLPQVMNNITGNRRIHSFKLSFKRLSSHTTIKQFDRIVTSNDQLMQSTQSHGLLVCVVWVNILVGVTGKG